WETTQNCPSLQFNAQISYPNLCIRCTQIHKPCNGNYALCYRFPWHLFSDRDNIVLSDKDAIEIKGVPSFQTFDNPTPASQPLPLNESLLIIPSINLEIGERESKDLAIMVKIHKEGKPYREVVMELDTGSDVTWITSALFDFLKLKKIESDEIIYGHSGYEIPVVCKAEVIIKIRKVKSKIIVYVNNDINYLNE
ncbi:13213_t:CDS:1, partial [Dentiscutata heterogama]